MSAHTIAQLLPHLFLKPTPRKWAPPRRLRLNCEGLEAREVPAALTWVGNGTLPSMNPANWSPAQSPANGDNLFFDDSSTANCTIITSPTLQFNSLNILEGYTGTVTVYTPSTFNHIVLQDGAIALTGGDLTITNSLNWTGGVLHNGTATRTVHMAGGSAASISPTAAGTVATGASLSFEYLNGVGSTGTFNPGTVEFRNAAHLEVDQLCSVQLGTASGASVFLRRINPASQFKLKGGMTLTNAENNETDLPLNITGGTLKVTAKLKVNGDLANIPGAGSVVMSSGTIQIKQGATLQPQKGLKMSGGTLTTLQNGTGVQTNATVSGDLVISGGEITYLQDAPNRKPDAQLIYGRLRVTGDMTWTGGTYRPVVYAPGGNASACDWLSILGTLAVTGGATGAKIAPGAIDDNGTYNAQQPAPTASWTILTAFGGITVTSPAPTVEGPWHLQAGVGTPVTYWAVVGNW